MMKDKKEDKNDEIRRLLEINGNTKNSSSIFDRLNISPQIDLDALLEDESFHGNYGQCRAQIV